jgi:membrane-associated phospholipid phosphatase
MSRINMPAASFAEPGRSWPQRLTALWREKIAVTIAANILFWVGYQFLSRHALRPVHSLPLTWLDQWAGFQPNLWVWVYESNFVLVAVIPWLIDSRPDLKRYLAGFAVLAAVSFGIFALFPVASPRPANLGTNAFMLFVTQADGPLNAFPSLHAGSLVYTLALARRLFRRELHPVAWLFLLFWGALILFGTLATKQHYAIDLLAGGFIGLGADWLAWSFSARPASVSVSTARSSGVASQGGLK